jgi:hypothetical protein
MFGKGRLFVWNVALAVSLVVVAASFAAEAILPMPSPKLGWQEAEKRAAELQREEADIRERAASARAIVQPALWSGDDDAIQSEAMALCTALAKSNRVSLNAFRPQKPVEESGLSRLPFLLSIEGPYPNALTFLRSLEAPKNRLGVTLVQITSADAASDLVTVTLGVAAYRELPSTATRTSAARHTAAPKEAA